VSGKERRTWGVSPACGGMCKCYTDGQSTSSSTSTERVCRGGDEAAEVQGEHKVKVDPRPEQASIRLTRKASDTWMSCDCSVSELYTFPSAPNRTHIDCNRNSGHSVFVRFNSIVGLVRNFPGAELYGIRSAAERSGGAVASEVTFSALDDDLSLSAVHGQHPELKGDHDEGRCRRRQRGRRFHGDSVQVVQVERAREHAEKREPKTRCYYQTRRLPRRGWLA
jgi:hypothetical protein